MHRVRSEPPCLKCHLMQFVKLKHFTVILGFDGIIRLTWLYRRTGGSVFCCLENIGILVRLNSPNVVFNWKLVAANKLKFDIE